MAEEHSKEWKKADAEFAKTQSSKKPSALAQPVVTAVDKNTAQLKAARLARDAAQEKSR